MQCLMFSTIVLSLAIVRSDALSVSQRIIIRVRGRSFDPTGIMRQAAETLNTPVPNNWETYVHSVQTTGNSGWAHMGTSNVPTVMTNWSIPQEFREEAVKNVRLLLLASVEEGSYIAQRFTFDVRSSTSIISLIIVARKLNNSNDGDVTHAVMYITVNSVAQTKQMYTVHETRRCVKCGKCLWTRRCCCKTIHSQAPRGLSPEELNVVLQKMLSDQYNYVKGMTLTETSNRAMVKRAAGGEPSAGLDQVVRNYLSSRSVREQAVTSYNDSLLSTIQTHFTMLKLSSQVNKFRRVATTNLARVFKMLADEHRFKDFYSDPQYAEKVGSDRFSYENLFSLQNTFTSTNAIVKYIWILAQKVDDRSYAIHFLTLNMTSESLIKALLSNKTNSSTPIQRDEKRLEIIRVSTFNATGEFFNENLLVQNNPWPEEKTETLMDLLRFITANALVPQQMRMLPDFNAQVLPASSSVLPQPRAFAAKLQALSTAISSTVSAIKGIMGLFGSSTSQTIERITRFGLNYFNQRTQILRVIDMPSERVESFINALIVDYNLPSQGSFTLGVTYSDDFTWEVSQFLYSPKMDGAYRSLTLYKNGDSVKNTASFFLVDVNANYTIAPDLLIISTTKSRFGGMFTSFKQTIQEVPHVLTLEEGLQLQQFFSVVALNGMAKRMGLNVTVS